MDFYIIIKGFIGFKYNGFLGHLKRSFLYTNYYIINTKNIKYLYLRRKLAI